jgi:hypothetical protein
VPWRAAKRAASLAMVVVFRTDQRDRAAFQNRVPRCRRQPPCEQAQRQEARAFAIEIARQVVDDLAGKPGVEAQVGHGTQGGHALRLTVGQITPGDMGDLLFEHPPHAAKFAAQLLKFRRRRQRQRSRRCRDRCGGGPGRGLLLARCLARYRGGRPGGRRRRRITPRGDLHQGSVVVSGRNHFDALRHTPVRQDHGIGALLLAHHADRLAHAAGDESFDLHAATTLSSVTVMKSLPPCAAAWSPEPRRRRARASRESSAA